MSETFTTPAPLDQLRHQLDSSSSRWRQAWNAQRWLEWAAAMRHPDPLHMRGHSDYTHLRIDPLWVLMRLGDLQSFRGWVEAGGVVDKCMVDTTLSWPVALVDVVSQNPHTPWYEPYQKAHHQNRIPAVHHPGNIGSGPAMETSITWRYTWLQQLLQAGASPYDPATRDNLIHHMATRGGLHPQLLNLVLSHHPHLLNEPNKHGSTPLMAAMACREHRHVRALWAKGAHLPHAALTPAMADDWVARSRKGGRQLNADVVEWCNLRVELAARGFPLPPQQADDDYIQKLRSDEVEWVVGHLARAHAAELAAALDDVLPVQAPTRRRVRL